MKKSIFCLFALAVVALSASATDLTISGSGTAESPYIIGTAADWNNLADYMATNTDSLTGMYVQLTADLDFSTDTIRQLGYGRVEIFNGDLDGNGKTMKGINAHADAMYFGGIIIESGSSSAIHDITVEGDVDAPYQYAGGLIGKQYGMMYNVLGKVNVTCNTSKTYMAGIAACAYSGASFTNCINEGNVTSANSYLAGLVASSAAGVVKYEDCGNRGTITYTGTVQFFGTYVVGFISNCYATTIKNCWNVGNVVCTNNGGCASGFLGSASSTAADPYFYMTGCYNTGDVTGCVAVGLIQTFSSYTCITMDSCYNTGNITSTRTSTLSNCYTAGLAGGTPGSGSTIRDCWNSGVITSNGLGYTGGLFGYYRAGTSYYSSSLITTISRCHNSGDVISPQNYVGGLVAYQYKYVVIDSCYNTGNIQGATYVGGLVGCTAGAGTVISNSYNTGDVTATTQYAGGIAGYSTNAKSITDCFNTGNVTSASSYSGGIAGLSPAAISNVYNTGTITGSEYVGGLIGATVAKSTAISYSYSIGNVVASGTSYGNIIGVNTTDTVYWGEGNSMSGTYYLTANAATGAATDTASTGLSYAELAKLDLGDNWTAGDNYTYPRLATLADNDYAKAHAAAVVPADGDSYSSITTGFNVGTPDGVTWTASSGSVEIDGNNVTFSESFSGTLTMTATSGDVSVATELTCNVVVSGINALGEDGRTVAKEQYFTPSGIQIAEPDGDSTAVYIVVKTYDDGTTETVKEVR